MDAADFVNLMVSALLLAGIYAAMSVGMTIIYGVMKIVNLAHAGFLMLGAYYVLELHERLNIDPLVGSVLAFPAFLLAGMLVHWTLVKRIDRKSTRLNSSHLVISYDVFCLKKKR